MRLLYIMPAFQHPQVRGPTRHYHFVRELSRKHALTLLVLNRSEIGREALDELASYAERLHLFDVSSGDSAANRLARPLPLLGDRAAQQLRMRMGIRRMRETFAREIAGGSHDAVVFHGKSVFAVIRDGCDLPVVVDFCDATSMRIRQKLRCSSRWKRPWLWLKYFHVRRVETALLSITPHVAFISPRDRRATPGAAGRAEILPNGVDHTYWQRRSGPSQRNRIVFTGVMDYAPNHDAAICLIERIVPRVRRSVPDLEVMVVGRDPTDALRELGRQSPGVTVTGFVDDVRPYLEEAAVFAAPLRYASGTQNKVLEALAMELPVVTSSVVADGLRMDEAHELPLCVADDEDDFAAEITRLLRRPEERSRMGIRGRQFVADHFIWSRSAEKLEQMCLAAVANGRRHSEPLVEAQS